MAKDKKLNNLLDIKDFSEKELEQKKKSTKRTDVAKDILQEKSETGKDVFTEKPQKVEKMSKKDLNNLISFDDYSEKEVLKDVKKTKRTDVAKDVVQEKKKECKEECDEPKKKKGLTAGQKKLPKAMQDAILKKQK